MDKLAMAGQAWFATGKLLDASAPRSHGRRFRRGLPRRLRLEVRPWPARFGAVEHASRDPASPRSRPPFSVPSCSSAWDCWTKTSNRTWKTSISESAARPAGLSGLYVPAAVAYHQGSATLAAGIRTRCEKFPAISYSLWRNTIPANGSYAMVGPYSVAQALWGFVAFRHGSIASLPRRQAGRSAACFGSNRGEACPNLTCHPGTKRAGNPRNFRA